MKRIALLGSILLLVSSCAGRSASSSTTACQSMAGTVDVGTLVSDEVQVRDMFDSMLRLSVAPDSLAVMIWQRSPAVRMSIPDSATLTPSINFALRRVMEQSVTSTTAPAPPVMFLAHLDADTVHLSATRVATCRPELINQAELVRTLNRAYAQLRREGSTMLMMRIDETGTPVDIFVSESSGDPTIDALAVSVGYAARFQPALIGGRPTTVFVGFPITFAGRR